MADEARVTLQLDVEDAKRVIAGLSKDAETAGSTASGGIRRAIRRGVTAFGFGAGVGAGIEAIRGPTSGGVGDIVGESFNKLGYDIEQWALGSLGEQSRASMQARDQLVQTFAASVGATNRITPGMREWFDSAKTLRQQEEHGKTLINQDKYFQGPGIEALIERVTSALAGLLHDAVGNLIKALTPPCFR